MNSDELVGKKIGKLRIVEKISGSGKMTKYTAKCACGNLFPAHAFRLTQQIVTCCPPCRKTRKNRSQVKYREIRNIVGRDFPTDETKYTLMNKGKTKIIKSSLGKYLFFKMSTARTAARNILGGTCVVPLEEAEELLATQESR